MILPLSTAFNLYWLGRYCLRLEKLTKVLPFSHDADAQAYAFGCGLGIHTADSLNKLFMDGEHFASLPATIAMIKQNIQAVRGVLSARSFESFYTLDAAAPIRAIKASLAVCAQALAGERALVQQFYRLGMCIEEMDVHLRFAKLTSSDTAQIKAALSALPASWSALALHFDGTQLSAIDLSAFYALCEKIHAQFKGAQ